MASKAFAVLGDPISHSLSPRIHLAAYNHLGLNYSYEAIQVPAGGLRHFIENADESFSGFSITMPLKFEAAAIATSSFLFGTNVANTLVRSESDWAGYNTDIAGIAFALRRCFETRPARVAILGAGATARSALVAICNGGYKEATIYARDLAKTEEIVNFARELGMTLTLRELSEFGLQQDLTINTLPSGVAENFRVNGKQSGWMFAANYANQDKSFSDSFAADKRIDGLEMLLGQALEQIKLFTAGDIDFSQVDSKDLVEVMRSGL